MTSWSFSLEKEKNILEEKTNSFLKQTKTNSVMKKPAKINQPKKKTEVKKCCFKFLTQLYLLFLFLNTRNFPSPFFFHRCNLSFFQSKVKTYKFKKVTQAKEKKRNKKQIVVHFAEWTTETNKKYEKEVIFIVKCKFVGTRFKFTILLVATALRIERLLYAIVL